MENDNQNSFYIVSVFKILSYRTVSLRLQFCEVTGYPHQLGVVVIPNNHPRSVCNRREIELLGGDFVLCHFRNAMLRWDIKLSQTPLFVLTFYFSLLHAGTLHSSDHEIDASYLLRGVDYSCVVPKLQRSQYGRKYCQWQKCSDFL